MFEAALEKNEFEESVAEAVMRGIIEISPSLAVSTFAEAVSDWDRDKLDEIVKIIEQKRKGDKR